MAQYRFATPVWPLAALTTALAADGVLVGLTPARRLAAGTVSALLAALTLSGFASAARSFQQAPTAALCDIAANTGYLFNGYADILGVRDGSLLAVDGGGTSLTTRLDYVDLSGLTERRIAADWQRDDMAGLRDYVLDEVKPTFVKIFSGWAERSRLDLADDPRFRRDYVMLLASVPGAGQWVRAAAVPDAAALEAGEEQEGVWLAQQANDQRAGVLLASSGALPPTWLEDAVPATVVQRGLARAVAVAAVIVRIVVVVADKPLVRAVVVLRLVPVNGRLLAAGVSECTGMNRPHRVAWARHGVAQLALGLWRMSCGW